jgi:hypothetical protein
MSELKYYEVEVTQQLHTNALIEAASEAEAMEIAERIYDNDVENFAAGEHDHVTSVFCERTAEEAASSELPTYPHGFELKNHNS